MRNISCEIILNLDHTWFKRKCRLKIFLTYSTGGPFVQHSRTICAILVEGNYEKHFFEIILNLDQWFRKMPFKDIAYLELWWPLCSAERNHLFSFGPGHDVENLCKIILNFDQWFWVRRRS